MTYKIFYLFFIFFAAGYIIPTSFAESSMTCPSLASAKAGRNIWPNGSWLPLYTSNHELALDQDVARFQKQITALTRVEWNATFPEAGHCYYYGNNDISLARDMLAPDVSLYPKWLMDKMGVQALCMTSHEDECPFAGSG